MTNPVGVNIESAYLNADQETKLERLSQVYEKVTGKKFVPHNIGDFPPQWKTMRILLEMRYMRDELEKFTVEELLADVANAVAGYDEVFVHELEQVRTGTQEFVPENLEASQD